MAPVPQSPIPPFIQDLLARGAAAATKVKQAPRAAAAREGSDDLLLRGDKLVESVPVEGLGEASVDDCAEETPT
eukprot:scaffold107515_cov60-Phaeocystis_antarctica.AAC.1